jgi:spore germination protein KB
MMNEKLKTSQFMFLAVSFIMGSTLLITMIDGITSHDTWLVVIIGFITCLPFLLIYAHLSKRFPGKSLIEMSGIIFGKVIGKIVSVIYVAWFFLVLSFNINDVAGFYNGYVMPDTPEMVFIVIFTLVCAFAVKRGLTAIAKVSLLTAVFTILAVVFTTLMLVGNMDLSNFLPPLDKPLIRYVQATQITAELPFMEVVSLLMVVPLIKDNRKLTRSWVSGAAIAALLIFTITVRDTAVLGGASDILGDNAFEAIRLINIGEFLTRIELLIAINYTASLFIKICVLYYVTLNAISQLLGIERNNSLILPLGSIAIVFASIKVESAVVHTIWGAQYAPVFSFPCTVFFPLLMVVVAAIRKLRTPAPEAQLPQESLPKKKIKRREQEAITSSEGGG